MTVTTSGILVERYGGRVLCQRKVAEGQRTPYFRSVNSSLSSEKCKTGVVGKMVRSRGVGLTDGKGFVCS